MDNTRTVTFSYRWLIASGDLRIETDPGLRRAALPASLATPALLPITAIGSLLGHEDSGWLVRAFRHGTGETPESVRLAAGGGRGA